MPNRLAVAFITVQDGWLVFLPSACAGADFLPSACAGASTGSLTSRGDVMRFSTASTTPSFVNTPIAVEPSCKGYNEQITVCLTCSATSF